MALQYLWDLQSRTKVLNKWERYLLKNEQFIEDNECTDQDLPLSNNTSDDSKIMILKCINSEEVKNGKDYIFVVQYMNPEDSISYNAVLSNENISNLNKVDVANTTKSEFNNKHISDLYNATVTNQHTFLAQNALFPKMYNHLEEAMKENLSYKYDDTSYIRKMDEIFDGSKNTEFVFTNEYIVQNMDSEEMLEINIQETNDSDNDVTLSEKYLKFEIFDHNEITDTGNTSMTMETETLKSKIEYSLPDVFNSEIKMDKCSLYSKEPDKTCRKSLVPFYKFKLLSSNKTKNHFNGKVKTKSLLKQKSKTKSSVKQNLITKGSVKRSLNNKLTKQNLKSQSSVKQNQKNKVEKTKVIKNKETSGKKAFCAVCNQSFYKYWNYKRHCEISLTHVFNLKSRKM